MAAQHIGCQQALSAVNYGNRAAPRWTPSSTPAACLRQLASSNALSGAASLRAAATPACLAARSLRASAVAVRSEISYIMIKPDGGEALRW